MAGSGYKLFASGEVLTAANLQGYAVDQSVMVFASSAARTTALAAPSEGMVSWLSDSNLLEVYDGANWKQISAATGSVLQVVSTTKVDTYSVSLATTVISGDVTGLTAAITPVSTSNKVLVTGSVAVGCSSAQSIGAILYRNTSALTAANGTVVGSRTGVLSAQYVASAGNLATINFQYLDSPASVSAQTYSIRLIQSGVGTNTVYVNRDGTDTNAANTYRAQSTITAQEIAA